MIMRRRQGKRKSRPSDHDPKPREEVIALATMVGVNYQRGDGQMHGWLTMPDGRILNSPFFQQQYMVAEFFVDVLGLRETEPCDDHTPTPKN